MTAPSSGFSNSKPSCQRTPPPPREPGICKSSRVGLEFCSRRRGINSGPIAIPADTVCRHARHACRIVLRRHPITHPTPAPCGGRVLIARFLLVAGPRLLSVSPRGRAKNKDLWLAPSAEFDTAPRRPAIDFLHRRRGDGLIARALQLRDGARRQLDFDRR